VTDKIGAAVVGVGYAGRQHLEAYRRHPAIELRGVVTRDPGKLSPELRAQIPCVTANLDDVLADPAVQIVSICTPDILHAEQAERALAAGKHVLCEKPLAPSAEECRRILEAAERAGKKVMTGQILRFAPQFESIHKMVRTGELGEPFFAEADYLHNLEPFLGGWRSDPAHRPNLVLGGGCHPIDLLRWLIGDVVEVHAYANRRVLTQSAYPHDCILISLTFANGCIGKVLVSGGCKRPYALNLSVYGDRGTVQNDKLFLDRIDHLQDWMNLPLPVEEEYPYYYEEIDHFVQSIQSGASLRVDGAEGAKTVAVCLAAQASIDRRSPVAVAEFEAAMGLA